MTIRAFWNAWVWSPPSPSGGRRIMLVSPMYVSVCLVLFIYKQWFLSLLHDTEKATKAIANKYLTENWDIQPGSKKLRLYSATQSVGRIFFNLIKCTVLKINLDQHWSRWTLSLLRVAFSTNRTLRRRFKYLNTLNLYSEFPTLHFI